MAAAFGLAHIAGCGSCVKEEPQLSDESTAVGSVKPITRAVDKARVWRRPDGQSPADASME